MAETRSSTLGRALTALGALWMAWAVVTGLLAPPLPADLSLPFLPGLLFFFVGRALSKAARRQSLPDVVPSRPQARVETRDLDADRRRSRPVTRREPETRHQTDLAPTVRSEPEMAAEPPPTLPDLEDLELARPMTSEEMVAEARRAFNPRPIERPGSEDRRS